MVYHESLQRIVIISVGQAVDLAYEVHLYNRGRITFYEMITAIARLIENPFIYIPYSARVVCSAHEITDDTVLISFV